MVQRLAHPPRIAAVGLATWDHLIVVDRSPRSGDYAIVREEAWLPGGTTANSAVALARLGADVALAATVGDDVEGETLRAAITAEGVDTGWFTTKAGIPTDRATVIVSSQPPDRTILWRQGARLAKGDRLDIAAMFQRDVVLLDMDDLPLRRFLVDLPAHTAPRTQLLGTLTYLAESDEPDALDIALRHDVIVGTERQLVTLTRAPEFAAARCVLQANMPGANLRAAVITHGSAGCTVITAGQHQHIESFNVAAVDPTGAGDAFAAGVASGLARNWAWPEIARFANAVGALATRALGAQTALPTLAEVASLLHVDPATLLV